MSDAFKSWTTGQAGLGSLGGRKNKAPYSRAMASPSLAPATSLGVEPTDFRGGGLSVMMGGSLAILSTLSGRNALEHLAVLRVNEGTVLVDAF